MAEATEHHEPTLDRKAIALIVILLSLVGVLLAELTFDRHTDRSEGPVLAVFGLLYVLSQAHRKLAAWSNGWSWRRFGDFWPWTVIGLDGNAVAQYWRGYSYDHHWHLHICKAASVMHDDSEEARARIALLPLEPLRTL